MGKKKSNNKKKDDYWDEAFEEDAAIMEQPKGSDDENDFAQRSANFSALAEEGGDDSEDGLMAMVNKAAKSKVKKNKKKKQQLSDDDFNEPPPPPPPAADSEGDDDYMMSMASNKKNKKKKNKLDIPLPMETPKASEPAEEPTRILTKKEKEKLKKERAKEAKRLAAEEKKKKQADEDAEFDRLLGTEDQPEAADDEPATKSKSQLKKEKLKKKAAAAAAAADEPAPPPPAVETPILPPGGKGKKGKAGVAALRKMLEAQKIAEEEAKRKEEEERLIREEEERLLAEEEERLEQARLAKKEREKAKKEQLRKDGKLLTKAQKEAQRRAQIRNEQLLASGQIKIAALDKDDNGEAAAAKPKRVVYGKKKRGPSKAELDKQMEEERKRKEEEERKRKEEEAKKQESEESSDDDWEKAADTSEDEKEPEPAKKEESGVKSDWEDEDESEEESTPAKPAAKPSAKPAAKSAPAPAKGKKQQAESSDEDSEDDSDDDDESDDDSDSDDWDSDDSSEEELTAAQKQALVRKEEAAARRVERQQAAMAARSKDDLRSPICCILGHVDTGKTKLLDKIRQTNVQEGEAGGITQQIGATYFPADAIEKKTAVLGEGRVEKLKVPGLLVIDTPGHESFTNLRTRGSSLCNIAILVVDIMHGLEPQTIESIRLLRDRRTPFIVALNKIDRLFQWDSTPDNSFQDSLAKQKKSVRDEFETRVQQTKLQFAEQGLNAELYYNNKNFAKYVSLVPTSAHTGEGVPDMLNLLVNLTQSRMSDKLMYITELECTVLEVKVIEGLGTTIDVVLVNGWLHEGDKIVVCGLNGPIVTQVRALLTPQPLRELRVKSQYVHHKQIKAAMGVKISAPDLEKAIAGSRLLVCGPDDDEDELMDEVMSDLTDLMTNIDRTGHGVWVQASTLGALEALLEFLRTSKIPVAGINIGPVHKKDVVKASVMLEKAREYAMMLCFDVKVDKDAEDMADDMGLKIFKADIIYHLFDRFVEYREAMLEQKRKDQAPEAVFPAVLRMVPGAIFNKKDPIIIGVDIVEGALRVGTPLCVVRANPDTKEKEIIKLGKVTSIEQNHKSMEIVKKGQAGGGVAIKIECAVYETPKTFGRHLEEKDEIYSRITRGSIDILKESFRKDMTKEDWALVVKLKKTLNIE